MLSSQPFVLLVGARGIENCEYKIGGKKNAFGVIFFVDYCLIICYNAYMFTK